MVNSGVVNSGMTNSEVVNSDVTNSEVVNSEMTNSGVATSEVTTSKPQLEYTWAPSLRHVGGLELTSGGRNS